MHAVILGSNTYSALAISGTCRSIEVRLASSGSVFDEDVRQFSAVVFGEGNYRTPTERRPAHLNFILAIRFNWDL